jgi:hypothetical protein
LIKILYAGTHTLIYTPKTAGWKKILPADFGQVFWQEKYIILCAGRQKEARRNLSVADAVPRMTEWRLFFVD